MATSGINSALIDVSIDCDVCGYTGDAVAREDHDDRSLTGNCPRCGEEFGESYDDRGATTVATALILFGCGLILIAALIRSAPLAITGVAIALPLFTYGVIRWIADLERNHS